MKKKKKRGSIVVGDGRRFITLEKKKRSKQLNARKEGRKRFRLRGGEKTKDGSKERKNTRGI